MQCVRTQEQPGNAEPSTVVTRTGNPPPMEDVSTFSQNIEFPITFTVTMATRTNNAGTQTAIKPDRSSELTKAKILLQDNLPVALFYTQRGSLFEQIIHGMHHNLEM